MQRVVIDTNTWVSGLIWGGPPRLLIQQVLAGQLESLTCPEIIAEFSRVLSYPRIEKVLLARRLAAVDLAEQIRLASTVIAVTLLPKTVSRDKDDDLILACAGSGHADLIVTGDDDLLVLREYDGIPIMHAAQALLWIGNGASPASK